MGYKDFENFDGATGEHQETIITLDGSAERIELPDASYVKDAELSRDGMDLVLDGPQGQIVVDGYFAQVEGLTLHAPDGSSLNANLVNSFVKSSPLYADSGSMSDESPVGAVHEVTGGATVTRVDGSSETIQLGTPIYQGDIIETAGDGAVNVMFIDETSFAVSEDARLAIDEYVFDPTSSEGVTNFSVLKGVFVFTSGLIGREDPDDVNIETPVGSIGIRGTIIAGDVNSGEITVVEGAIVLRDAMGNEMTLANQFETAQFDTANGTINNMGQMAANDVAAKFSSVSGVAAQLFSSIDDVAQEQDANSESQTGENDETSQEQNLDANNDGTVDGTVDEDGDGSADGTVEGAQDGDAEGTEAATDDQSDASDAVQEGEADTQTASTDGETVQAPAPAPMQSTTSTNGGFGTTATTTSTLSSGSTTTTTKSTTTSTTGTNTQQTTTLTTATQTSDTTAIDTTISADTSTETTNVTNVDNPAVYTSYLANDVDAQAGANQIWSYNFSRLAHDRDIGDTPVIEVLIWDGGTKIFDSYQNYTDPSLLSYDLDNINFNNGILSIDIYDGMIGTRSLDIEIYMNSTFQETIAFDYFQPIGALVMGDENDISSGYFAEITALSATTLVGTGGTVILSDANDVGIEIGNKTLGNPAINNYIHAGAGDDTISIEYGFGNSISGGRGDDTIVVKAADNFVYGSGGNDEIIINFEHGDVWADLLAADATTAKINGGTNNPFFINFSTTVAANGQAGRTFNGNGDILKIEMDTAVSGNTAGDLIDFSAMANDIIFNIEILDITNADNNEVRLNTQDIFDMTDHRNTLVIRGDNTGDALNFDAMGKGYTYGGTIDDNVTTDTYDVYFIDGTEGVTLLVDTDIATTITA